MNAFKTGALLALLMPFGLLAEPNNWERFRGPNGTGKSDSNKIPTTFSSTEGVVWKVPLKGTGNSSPIIWNDRVFVHSSEQDGTKRYLISLDATNGKVLWTKEFSGAKAKTHVKNSLASCTPTTDGERIYNIVWNGEEISLFAHDFNGKEVWKRDFGKYVSQHGPGHSPIVVNGKIIFNNDQDGSAQLFALDSKTGKTVWEAPRKAFRACYSTPILNKSPEGKMELLVGTTAGITSYDPDKGSENWSYTWSFTKSPLRTVASPIVAAGVVIACSGDGAGDRHLIAVRLGGKGDVTGTNLAWENRKIFPYVPTMLSKDDFVFSVTDKGMAMCHIANSGKEVWTNRLDSPVTASPVMIGDNIFAIGEDGTVYVFKAQGSFQQIAKNSMGEPVFASPAVANDKLFVRGKEHLFCIGKK